MENKNLSEDVFLDTNGICSMLDISVWTAVKWTTRKKNPIPSFKLGWRTRRFSKAAVLAWAEAQGKKSAS